LNPRLKIKTGVETRVSETNAFSPEETSESYAHAFHFSMMVNQQTIALSGKIEGRNEASNQVLQGGWLNCINI